MRIYEGKIQRGVIRNVDFFMDTRVVVAPIADDAVEVDVVAVPASKKKAKKKPKYDPAASLLERLKVASVEPVNVADFGPTEEVF